MADLFEVRDWRMLVKAWAAHLSLSSNTQLGVEIDVRQIEKGKVTGIRAASFIPRQAKKHWADSKWLATFHVTPFLEP